MIDCSGRSGFAQNGCAAVVKPPREGSSVGIRVVKEEIEALPAMEHAAGFSDDLLVEEFVEGRELTVGVLRW